MEDQYGQPPGQGSPGFAYGGRAEYAVPTYTAPASVVWYHFLHGNVPGHQIDFMYRPEVPQGPLQRQHFSHLARLMKYIEPHTNSEYAFAVGNLSRDDTQYEPGHGGLALIFMFRLRGATDAAGRRDPPFAHAIAAVDRSMDYTSLLSSSLSFFQKLLGNGPHAGPSAALYREYVRCVAESPGFIEDALRTYTSGFDTLLRPAPSALSLKWITDGAAQPKRIVIVHPDDAPFGALAECAAKVAAVLYRSDIRWTAITSGRESEVPNGVTIRLVSARDAGAYDASGGPVMSIDDVPDDEGALAAKLFGARSAVVEEAPAQAGWRQLYGGSRGSPSGPPGPMPGAPPPPRSDAGYGGPDGARGAPPPEIAGYEPPRTFGESGRFSPRSIREEIAALDAGSGAPPPRGAPEVSAYEPPKTFGESGRYSPRAIREEIAALDAGAAPAPPPVAAVNAAASALSGMPATTTIPMTMQAVVSAMPAAPSPPAAAAAPAMPAAPSSRAPGHEQPRPAEAPTASGSQGAPGAFAAQRAAGAGAPVGGSPLTSPAPRAAPAPRAEERAAPPGAGSAQAALAADRRVAAAGVEADEDFRAMSRKRSKLWVALLAGLAAVGVAVLYFTVSVVYFAQTTSTPLEAPTEPGVAEAPSSAQTPAPPTSPSAPSSPASPSPASPSPASPSPTSPSPTPSATGRSTGVKGTTPPPRPTTGTTPRPPEAPPGSTSPPIVPIEESSSSTPSGQGRSKPGKQKPSAYSTEKLFN